MLKTMAIRTVHRDLHLDWTHNGCGPKFDPCLGDHHFMNFYAMIKKIKNRMHLIAKNLFLWNIQVLFKFLHEKISFSKISYFWPLFICFIKQIIGSPCPLPSTNKFCLFFMQINFLQLNNRLLACFSVKKHAN